MPALTRSGPLTKAARTWRPLLGLCALVLLLVTASGCDGGVAPVALDEVARESVYDSESAMQGSVPTDVVESDRGMAQVSPSSAVSQDALSQQPAAPTAAASRPALPHGS